MSVADSQNWVLRLKDVAKTYYERSSGSGSIKELALRVLSEPASRTKVQALRGVSFCVSPGQAVGIVGANGSGKSTLLKVIAGIVQPTRGTVDVKGRVVGMIELGAGFHFELSGEENVHLQGAIYGLSKQHVVDRIDRVFEYAELEYFRRTPVKHYSSGMVARLGFSIAIHCEPELLIVDEVLSVGDQSFQERCLRTIQELQASGVTVVFVTHHMEFAERLCDHLIWLKKGEVYQEGKALEILQNYHQEMLEDQYGESEGELTMDRIRVDEPGRFGTGQAQMSEVRTIDAQGHPRRNFRPGEPFGIEIAYTCSGDVGAIDCSIALDFEDGTTVAFWRAEPEGGVQKPAGGEGRFRLMFDEPQFLPGHYRFNPAISKPGGAGEHYDLHLRLHHFAIIPESYVPPTVPLELSI